MLQRDGMKQVIIYAHTQYQHSCMTYIHLVHVCHCAYMCICALAAAPHSCHKNYSGSARSMEADMAVEMFARAPIQGMKYSKLIGDEDATTTAHLRQHLPPSLSTGLEKLSDPNHIKKILGNRLRELAFQRKQAKNKHTVRYYTHSSE